MTATPRVSVLMPTFEQSRFIGRAIDSLRAQTLRDWELVIVDDGSRDATLDAIAPFRDDPRVCVDRLPENRGLGAALNRALDLARGELLAYLPSDDLLYPDHLASLVATLDAHLDASLAYASVRHHYNRRSDGPVEGFGLQLVQVMHRRIPERWLERGELVTDDLERMYWSRVRARGRAIASGALTCEWTMHPGQLHALVREPLGGINPYRARFTVAHPLRFHSSVGDAIDEVALYRRFRERAPTPRAADGLRVLFAGELAYNPERVLALEERGHELFGLWTPEPYWFNTVGPLPFGHVRDVPRERWPEVAREVRVDVIYALLNWQAIPFVHHVINQNPGIPLVWHFKEGPFVSLEKGTWPLLVDIYRRADGRIYSTPELREWMHEAIPGLDPAPELTLDGDLPKREWFDGAEAPLLSELDGEPHTVVPGRPIGLHPGDVGTLAASGVHLHFYGEFTHGQWREWIERAGALASGRLHLHESVDQSRWRAELSRYDAGWLHVFDSRNGGDLRRALWDDLNYPARMGTFAVAGLPMLLRDNTGSRVAVDALARELGVGLFFRDFAEVGAILRDRERVRAARRRVREAASCFMFDAHADRLVAFLRRIAGRA